MSEWRDKYGNVADGGVPFWQDIRVDVTRHGAAYLAEHAKSLGMSRSAWIRLAMAEQLKREGVEEAPDLKPYRGYHLRLAVNNGH